MNWKLIFTLSLFGLAMAIATVFWIPSGIEPLFWLAIFILCAWLIAGKCAGRYFLHGLFTGLANCVWITSTHILLFDTYVANHVSEAAMLNKMPLPDSPRLMMLMTGILIGIISGLVLGGFSVIAWKIRQRKK